MQPLWGSEVERGQDLTGTHVSVSGTELRRSFACALDFIFFGVDVTHSSFLARSLALGLYSSSCACAFGFQQPHIHFYGYEFSDKWLIRFAEKRCPETLRDCNDESFEDDAITRAFELITDLAGVYTLGCKECFNPKDGSVPQEWIAVYDGDYDDELMNISIHTIKVA